MKAGDIVRVIAVPPSLPDNEDTKLIFERCVGRVFPVVDVRADGLAELEVGEVMGVLASFHSIWIELEHLELVRSRAD